MYNQFNCRVFDSESAGRFLHVHDNPGYTVDALRCQQNGWDVQLNRCLLPDLPYTDGDTRTVVYTTMDLVRR